MVAIALPFLESSVGLRGRKSKKWYSLHILLLVKHVTCRVSAALSDHPHPRYCWKAATQRWEIAIRDKRKSFDVVSPYAKAKVVGWTGVSHMAVLYVQTLRVQRRPCMAPSAAWSTLHTVYGPAPFLIRSLVFIDGDELMIDRSDYANKCIQTDRRP